MSKIFLDLKERYPQEWRNIIYQMRVEILLIPVLWVVFVVVVNIFPDTESGLGRILSFVSSWAFVLTLVWCFIHTVYEVLYHWSYKYYIENNSFVVSWGILTKSRDVSLLTRISDVKINRTFLQRLLRLADIEVFTPNDTVSGTQIPGLSIDSCIGIQKMLINFVDKEELDPQELKELLSPSKTADA